MQVMTMMMIEGDDQGVSLTVLRKGLLDWAHNLKSMGVVFVEFTFGEF